MMSSVGTCMHGLDGKQNVDGDRALASVGNAASKHACKKERTSRWQVASHLIGQCARATKRQFTHMHAVHNDACPMRCVNMNVHMNDMNLQ